MVGKSKVQCDFGNGRVDDIWVDVHFLRYFGWVGCTPPAKECFVRWGDWASNFQLLDWILASLWNSQPWFRLFVYVDNLIWHFCDIFDTSWAIFGLNISDYPTKNCSWRIHTCGKNPEKLPLCVNCYRGSWHICGIPWPHWAIQFEHRLLHLQIFKWGCSPFHFKWQCQSEQHLQGNWGWMQWSNVFLDII